MGKYKDFLQNSGIYECTECPLSNRRRGVCVYRGYPTNPVMIIGEAPGEMEDRKGMPMVGLTGTYLIDTFLKFGISLPEHLYITNSVLCHPPADRTPTEDELDACSRWLDLQIRTVRPRFIIAAGRVAAGRLLSDFGKSAKITEFEGKEFILPHYNNAICIPIRHPSAIMRAPSTKSDYEMIVERISNKIKKSLSEEPYIAPEMP